LFLEKAFFKFWNFNAKLLGCHVRRNGLIEP